MPLRDELASRFPEATVESVHRSAINLRLGTSLATVACESVGGLPMGLLLAGEPALDRLRVMRGMPVVLGESEITIPAASLAVDLQGAVTWSPAMPVLSSRSADLLRRRAASAVRLAADAPPIGLAPLLSAMAGKPVASGGALAARVGPAIANLLESVAAGDVARAADYAQPLVGLGPGATPSGDDLLVGLLAGMAAARHPHAAALASRIGRQAVGRTTALSEQFLVDAGRLRFSERVQRITTVVLVGDAGELRAAIEATLAWGASSGADLLAGLLIAIGMDRPELAATLRGLARPSEAAA